MVEPGTGMAAFIDVETTGLNPAKDEIIELAIALFSFDRETGEIVETVDEYCGFRESFCPISKAAFKKNRITEQEIKGCVLDNVKIKNIIDKTEFLIAHNARFDASFIVKLFPDVLSKPWYCSMNGIDWKGKGFESISLQNLLRDHDISIREAHRAGADVESSLKLLSKTNENGDTYLFELISGEKFNPNCLSNFDNAMKEFTHHKSENKFKQFEQWKAKDFIASTTEFDINHPFYKKYIAFTGELVNMDRKDAMQNVANVGGACQDNVNKKTDYLILGKQDTKRLNGKKKSSKTIKAEKMISQGRDIKILKEEDFYKMLGGEFHGN